MGHAGPVKNQKASLRLLQNPVLGGRRGGKLKFTLFPLSYQIQTDLKCPLDARVRLRLSLRKYPQIKVVTTLLSLVHRLRVAATLDTQHITVFVLLSTRCKETQFNI